jgi:hypothetical protein
MQTLKVNFSSEIFSVLSSYPEWLKMIIQVIEQPPLSINYCPSIVEVFDQYGLLSGRIHGCFSYESTRNTEQESEFTAWFLDGELAVFYVGSELVINRLQILAVEEGEFL